jgi:hypothetical protein
MRAGARRLTVATMDTETRARRILTAVLVQRRLYPDSPAFDRRPKMTARLLAAQRQQRIELAIGVARQADASAALHGFGATLRGAAWQPRAAKRLNAGPAGSAGRGDRWV